MRRHRVIDDKKHNITITATELKMSLGKYLDYVIDNNEVVITKNGSKAVRLIPYLSDYDRYELMKNREQALDYQYGGKKVSYEEFIEISEKSNLRMEFINGEIILMDSPNFVHQEISGHLYVIFRNYLAGKKCKVVYAPFDVRLYKPEIKDPDVCQPDLIVACDVDETLDEKGKYTVTPTLVVEILSICTRSKDMVKKLNTYLLSGLKEYWVVDPSQKTLAVYTFENLEVADFFIYRNDEVAISKALEKLSVSLKEVFA
jgi:prevent-host-death family protein